MTVSQLKKILENIEKLGIGDYQIRFCCDAKCETNTSGTGVVMLPSRTFDFSDGKYEFNVYNYLTTDGHSRKSSVCSDNIKLTPVAKTVTFHQF